MGSGSKNVLHTIKNKKTAGGATRCGLIAHLQQPSIGEKKEIYFYFTRRAYRARTRISPVPLWLPSSHSQRAHLVTGAAVPVREQHIQCEGLGRLQQRGDRTTRFPFRQRSESRTTCFAQTPGDVWGETAQRDESPTLSNAAAWNGIQSAARIASPPIHSTFLLCCSRGLIAGRRYRAQPSGKNTLWNGKKRE